MDIVVTCEYRFYRTPDGKVWTGSAFLYDFWLRYLDVFDSVFVVARIKDVDTAQDTWRLSSGSRVEFVALPYYVGLAGLLKNLTTIRSTIQRTATKERALIYRVPSQSAMLASLFRGKQHGYALEVVGDPYDVFSSGITHSWLDKVLAWLSYAGLKSMANHALAGCYVTKHYLQQRYPVGDNGLSVGCSDIELPDKKIRASFRTFTQPGKELVFVGSFAQLYKGPDLLIRALAHLKGRGQHFHANVLGGGIYLEPMQALAKELGCAECITFVGEVNHQQVMEYLDKADLFVMPSRTEGLPRALIEAMSRGLPCIASSVGGIPELLDAPYMIENQNWQSLADKIERLMASPTELTHASEQNLLRAREYEQSVLYHTRKQFYQSYRQLKQELL